MGNLKYQRCGQQWGFFFLILCFVTVSLCGCEPLRKKFTRQKKQTVETEEAPILETIEYPKQVETSFDLYKKYYSLWRVWHKELSDGMFDRMALKRESYLLNQITSNLTEMRNLVKDERRGDLDAVIVQVGNLKSKIESPLSANAITSHKRDLDALEKRIKKNFAPVLMKDNLKESF